MNTNPPHGKELDLFFQIYRSGIEYNFGKINLSLILDSYKRGFDKDQFYEHYIYLPL